MGKEQHACVQYSLDNHRWNGWLSRWYVRLVAPSQEEPRASSSFFWMMMLYYLVGGMVGISNQASTYLSLSQLLFSTPLSESERGVWERLEMMYLPLCESITFTSE